LWFENLAMAAVLLGATRGAWNGARMEEAQEGLTSKRITTLIVDSFGVESRTRGLTGHLRIAEVKEGLSCEIAMSTRARSRPELASRPGIAVKIPKGREQISEGWRTDGPRRCRTSRASQQATVEFERP
jgi:hypothetical protein